MVKDKNLILSRNTWLMLCAGLWVKYINEKPFQKMKIWRKFKAKKKRWGSTQVFRQEKMNQELTQKDQEMKRKEKEKCTEEMTFYHDWSKGKDDSSHLSELQKKLLISIVRTLVYFSSKSVIYETIYKLLSLSRRVHLFFVPISKFFLR